MAQPADSSCEAPHFQYHVSGKLAIRMDDGREFVAGPGEVTALPSGHDAWVVGDEPVWWWTGVAPPTTASRAERNQGAGLPGRTASGRAGQPTPRVMVDRRSRGRRRSPCLRIRWTLAA